MLRPTILLVVMTLGGCAGDDTGDSGPPQCVDLELETCSLAFQPTFDNIHTQVLGPTCSPAGNSCHGDANAIGAGNGLVMTDPDDAHATLVNLGFVVPGDASCSELMVRLESDDPLYRMPPGSNSLDASVRCSIATWIQDGAAR